jgi:hypothetical protein
MGKKKQRKMKETAEEHGFDKKKKLLLLLLLLLLTFEMFWRVDRHHFVSIVFVQKGEPMPERRTNSSSVQDVLAWRGYNK